MATKLTEYDFAASSVITTSEKAVYPWTEWLDGDIWQLTEGDDFHTHPLMMERIIRTRATARGAKVTVRHIPLLGINGKPRKNNPFGIIIMQRTDCIGPTETAANGAARTAKKAADAEKRAAKKAAAKQEAEEIVRSLKIVPNGKPSKKAAAKPTTAKKSISKNAARPVKAMAK